jgi:hypothetical protein
MAYYQYKNILFEYQEFEDCVGIINTEITQSTTNKVFKIPAEINGKPVTSFSNYGMYDFYIKNFTDIVIPSTIKDMCAIISSLPMNIYVDTIEHYFKICIALQTGRNSQLFVAEEKVNFLKLPPDIKRIRGLELDYIDCENIKNIFDTQFIMCDIKKLINTDNIYCLPAGFSQRTIWKESLHFENVTIINSYAFDLSEPITLNCPNLTFIESNIVWLDPFYAYKNTISIISKTNPIIYPQTYQINVNDCYTSGNH